MAGKTANQLTEGVTSNAVAMAMGSDGEASDAVVVAMGSDGGTTEVVAAVAVWHLRPSNAILSCKS